MRSTRLSPERHDIHTHFSPDASVDDIARRAGQTGGVSVDEVVQHTDSGSGNSQQEHWAANVEAPTGDSGLR